MKSSAAPVNLSTARRFDALLAIRSRLLAEHPDVATYRGGGAGRMLPLAQVLADRLTPEGEAILAQWEDDAASGPRGRERNAARRLQLQRRGRKRDAVDLSAAVADARRRLAELAAEWERDEAAVEWRRAG